MDCPHCHSKDTRKLSSKTLLGYDRYLCHACGKRYNERTGTVYNFLNYPTDIILLILFHYVRYKLSYEQVAEIFWLRGFKICGETIRLWVKTLGALIARKLREKRHGKAGKSWYVDETYVKIDGTWCYLYRARDKQGNLIDCYLSPNRDKASAVRFFESAVNVVGHEPDRVTTDKNPAYPDAIAKSFSKKVKHRDSKYLNNLQEQDHRDIKSRYYAMRCFKDFLCAAIFCTVYEEFRNFFKIFSKEKLNSTEKRRIFTSKYYELSEMALVL